jgi:hypothetical protein
MGDGPGGGPYQRGDEDVQKVWDAAVDLLRHELRAGWRSAAEVAGA